MNDVDIEDYHRNILQELNAVEEEGEISLSTFLNDLIDIDIESNFNFSYQVVSRVMQICVNSLNSNLMTLADACMHFMRYSISRCLKLEEEINQSFFENINTIIKICLNMRYFSDNRSLLFQRAFLSLIIELDKCLPQFMMLWKGYKADMCTFLTSLLNLISFHLTLLNDLLKELKKDEKLNCNRYMQVGCSRIKIIEIAFNLLLNMFKEIRQIPFISSLMDYVNLIVNTYDHIPDVEIKKKILSLCRCLYSSNSDGSRTHFAALPEMTNLLSRKRNNYLALTKEKDINMSYLRHCSYIYMSESHLFISTFSATGGETTNGPNGATACSNHGDAPTHETDGVSPSSPQDKVLLTPNGFRGCLLLNFFYAYFYNTQNKLLIVLCYDQVKVRQDPGGKMLVFRCSRMDALGALSSKLRTQYEGRLLDHIDICVKFRSESIKNKMFDVITEVISIDSNEPDNVEDVKGEEVNGEEAKDESDEGCLREGPPHYKELIGDNNGANSVDDDESDTRTNCVSGDEIIEEEILRRRKVSFASMKEICLMDYRTSMGTKTLLLDESLNEMDTHENEGVSDLTDEEDKRIRTALEQGTDCPSISKASSLGEMRDEVSEAGDSVHPEGGDGGESVGGMHTKVSYATTKDLENAEGVESEAAILEDDDLFRENELCSVMSESRNDFAGAGELSSDQRQYQLKNTKRVEEESACEDPQDEFFILSNMNKLCEQVYIGKRSQGGENGHDDDEEVEEVHVGSQAGEANEQTCTSTRRTCCADDGMKLLFSEPDIQLEEGKEDSRGKNKSDGIYIPQKSYNHGRNIPQGNEKQKGEENFPPYTIKEFVIKNAIEEHIGGGRGSECDAVESLVTADLWRASNNGGGQNIFNSPPEVVKELLNYEAKRRDVDEYIQSLTKPQVEGTSEGTQRGDLRRSHTEGGTGEYSEVVNIEGEDEASNEMIVCDYPVGGEMDGGGNSVSIGRDSIGRDNMGTDNCGRDNSGRNESCTKRSNLCAKGTHHIDKPSSSCKSKKRIATNEANTAHDTACTMNDYAAKNNLPDSPYPVKKTKYNYHDPKLLNLLKNEDNLDKLSAKYLIKAYTIIQYNRRNTHIQIADCFRSVRKEITTSFECINSKYVAWLKELQQKFAGRLERIVSRHSYMLLINKRRTGQINVNSLPAPIDLQIISTKMNTLQETLNIVQRTMEDKMKNLQILTAYKESDVYTSSLSLNTLLSRCSTQRLRESAGDEQSGGAERSAGEK
ncbi:hypothetical protein AK88_03972 [Plasmodium fragile]|uniref:Uncharacterized protein n=1 Tax=Plasmodium fragile TaxID=5857 RepID=A0A0D9QHB6_PLAFR|nr:uncharacterized protein AK88_03972 [Plasmodium fragile]KJP86419.1 hypothetical protein AK88_03972 [Plasmodium fragile]